MSEKISQDPPNENTIMNNTEKKVIAALNKAYWKEIETVMNYLAHSVNLDGIRSERIKEILAAEVGGEMEHARKLANRIKDLGGLLDGSQQFKAGQESNQPTDDTTDLRSVIQGVVDSEQDAIDHYRYIIEITSGFDPVTEDLCIQLLAEEENHLRIFSGFLKGLEKKEAVLDHG
jgi:bacterioferritin